LGFADWGKMFGHPVLTSALLGRLLHYTVVITFNGDNYRLRKHMDLILDHFRSKMSLGPPPPPRKEVGRKSRMEERLTNRAQF